MELTDLRYFASVASCESFVGGARRCGVTAPAISKSIKKLEEALGQRLLTRTTRSVVLTEAGAIVLARCRRIFAELETLGAELDELGRSVRGPLHVAANEVFSLHALPAALARVVREHPALSPRCYEMLPDQMETLLRDGRLDVGFTIGAGAARDIEYRELGRSEGVLVCGKDHPLAARGRVTARALREHPFVAPRFYGKEHLPSLDQFPEQLERDVTATIELLQMGVQLVVEGTHLGYFPKLSVFPRIAAGELVVLSGLPRRPPFVLHALTRKGAAEKRATTLLLQAVRREIRGHSLIRNLS
ncbi:MAG: LysR family transcriptional regulator [Myxococcales bacterium]|nr:LysR family transcriptional regulator [Myxococcales bacterium]